MWLDGQLFGTNVSLFTPHEYDLGALAPGKHTLTIRVDNRVIIDIGQNSHAISDHTQGDWNGIVGDISLRVTPPVWFEDLQNLSACRDQIRDGQRRKSATQRDAADRGK